MKKYNLFLFNTLTIIFLDICFKMFVFKDIFDISTLYMILLNIVMASIITIIETIFSRLINKILAIFNTIFIVLLVIAQFIYYKYYDAIFSIYSLFHGAQVFGFVESIIGVILQNILPILIMFIPIILFFVFYKRFEFERKNYKYYILLFIVGIITYISFILLLNISDKDKTYSSYSLYYNTHVPKLTVRDFGVLNEMRLDLKRTIFGFNEKVTIESEPEEIVIEEETKYNMMNIDFDKLIAEEQNNTIKSMHEYFKGVSPTKQNDYTGMFEGKNLIVFVAEAFSPMVIDENLTPTLYKLYKEGFQFTNFYTPVFYVSTSDGEYTSLQSLLPKEGTWSMSASSKNYLPFVYGNLFKNYGYVTNAYHDGVYTYYGRNNSHPNMGYKYKACYGGLNMNCGIWPQSDKEMIEKTIDEYVNEEHFMTYYMTISGHLGYTFMGNFMASKNKDFVKDLPYNESIKAYLACNIELDKALETLINKLEEAGKLDDTVIALSADHYPYGLKNEDIMAYADYVEDEKFDIHKNSFLLWNNTMEKSIKVTKYASSIDILPTILNLFGMTYDSRLLMGRDLLSDEDGLIIFNDRSWITSYGKYNSVNDTFTPYKENIDEDYVDKINKDVYNKFLMSKLILEQNYYSKILSPDDFIQKKEAISEISE